MLHEQGQKIESMFNELDEKISSNIRDRQEAYSMITENMDEILALVNDSVSNSKRSLGIQWFSIVQLWNINFKKTIKTPWKSLKYNKF